MFFYTAILQFSLYCVLDLAMPSLLLSDSLMKNCPEDIRTKLISQHNLDQLFVEWFPGKTTQEIIGPNGLIHPLMEKHQFENISLKISVPFN